MLKGGIFAWRQNSSGVFDREKGFFRTGPKRGVPDIIAIVPQVFQGYRSGIFQKITHSVFLGIEVKKLGGALREEQINFRENVENSGGLYWVVHSLEELKEKCYNEIKMPETAEKDDLKKKDRINP